jgi:hypothetical protein
VNRRQPRGTNKGGLKKGGRGDLKRLAFLLFASGDPERGEKFFARRASAACEFNVTAHG